MARLAGSACVWGAVRFAAVKIRTLIAIHFWNRRSLRTSISLVSLSAFLLLGCAAEYSQQDSRPQNAKLVIPLPKRALMQPQGEPGCQLEAPLGSEAAEQRQPPARELEPNRKQGQGDANAALGLRIRLEFERDCFRRAELQTRDRLHRLQAAVGKTIKTVKRIERNGF